MSGAVIMGPVPAVVEAARFVEREWGDGYSIGLVSAGRSYVVCEVVALVDGSRFFVAADVYGATGHGDTRAECRESFLRGRIDGGES